MHTLVVAGLLGAGKTRFILELIQRIPSKIVILENERGSVNIDGQRLRSEAHDGIEVREISDGCVCCTLEKDFGMTLMTIAQNFAPDLLIVEASGVAKLGALKSKLQALPLIEGKLLPPLLLIDLLNLDAQWQAFPETLREQLDNAGRVLLTKTDCLSQDACEAGVAQLQKLHPGHSYDTRPYADRDDAYFQGFLIGQDRRPGYLHPKQDRPLDALSLEGCTLAHPAELLRFLQALASGLFGQVNRAKGAFQCGKEGYRFDLVQSRYTIQAASATECQGQPAFFAGRHLRQQWLVEALHAAKQLYQPSGQLL